MHPSGLRIRLRTTFAINAKSTSMTPAKRFLNTHFIGKFRGRDLPLFVYKVRLSLNQPTGNYAVPGFQITGRGVSMI